MSPTEPLSPRLKQVLLRLITERIGVVLRKNDQINFQNFILSRVHAMGFTGPEEYYLLLNASTDKGHQEWELLISKITNTESFFFRDKGQFKLLRNYIFPKIIAEKSNSKTLRICSAGCSTGEEAYSIAILLKELIPDLNNWNIKILGIDINAAAIQKAKNGVYRPWSFRGLDKSIQQRFFKENKKIFYINETIRTMVDFQVGNLLDMSFLDPFSNIVDMDLILCRNVFIYFDNSAIETILNRFYNALLPSGYLLVGHTELHGQKSNRFHIKIFEESIAYQRPMNEFTQPTSEFLSIKPSKKSNQENDTITEHQDLSNLLKGSDMKMYRVSLNLLRQLPGDSRIAKLGNRTVSELILQLENSLKETD